MKKIIAAVLCAVLVLTAGGLWLFGGQDKKVQLPFEKGEAYVPSSPFEAADGFVTAASNERLSLEVNPESGAFRINDLESGAVWSSVPADSEEDELASGVYKMELLSNLIVYGVETEDNKEFKCSSEAASVRKDGLKVYREKDGFIAEYTFPDKGWTIPLSVILDGERVAVSIDTASVTEEDEGILITSVSVLPYMGAGGTDEEGYILLPDGCGSIMEFNNGRYNSEPYSAPVYGRDATAGLLISYTESQDICLPVFGVHKSGGDLLTIIDSGAETGTVHAEPNGMNTGYASAYCEFTLRPDDTFVFNVDSGSSQSIQNFYKGEIQSESCGLLLCPLAPGNGGYSGMARAVRAYLKENGAGNTGTVTAEQVYIDFYGAIKKKCSVLGIPADRVKILSSLSDVYSFAGELSADGGIPLALRYKSWTNDVINGRTENGMTPVSALGKSGDWERLEKLLADNGGSLWADAEIIKFTKGGNGVSTFSDICRSLSNSPAYQYDFRLSTGLRKTADTRGLLLSPVSVPDAVGRVYKSAVKRSITGLSLGSLTSMICSDFSSDTMLTRSGSRYYIERAVSGIPDSVSLVADNPFSYLLKYTGAAISVPVTSSSYSVTDYDVPFAQLVYSGLVDYTVPAINLSSDAGKMLCRAAETGAQLYYGLITGDNADVSDTSLSFLTGAESRDWKELIAQQYKALSEIRSKTGGSAIFAHETLENGVTRTLYENGVAVYVNYGENDAEINGITVPSGGFTAETEVAK